MMFKEIQLYLNRQASSTGRYILEQTLYLLFGWVPTLSVWDCGIFYRLIMRMDGWAAVENGARLRFADYIRLGHGAYLDQGVYLHACPKESKSARILS
jgi:hypothetical protein